MSGALLVRGALVVDGTGAEPQHGDVLVDGGRIVAVGTGLTAPGARVLDADGLALLPGFIDMHAHSDLAVLRDGDHLAKAMQGVTTEVVGQDGLAYAPVTPSSAVAMREQIAGWNGDGADVGAGWESVAAYLEEIDRRGSATNVAYLLPQGTIRMNVVGHDPRPATAQELLRMREQVAVGMREGAFGMSSGLTYVPGMYADTDELVALCEVVAAHGGFYAPHQRSYGAGALAAYQEMVEVAARSGCPVHLTHATMNFPENEGRAADLLALVDEALAGGIDVTLDSYPYTTGATTLAALLPGEAAAGGPERTLARLADADERQRIAHVIEVVGSDGCHGVPVDWSTIEIAGVRDPALASNVGRTVAELARQQGCAPSEVFFELLLADRLGTGILQHVGHEENVRTVMQHPRHSGGSDGILVGAKPHPRGWGTFARYLRRYVLEEGVLTLAQAAVHLCATPADRLGLRDRGRVVPGAVADLSLVDLQSVQDRATYDDPRQPAAGFVHVLVGGAPVVADGGRTEHRPGRALRHRPATT